MDIINHMGKAVDEGLLFRAFGQHIDELTDDWRAVHIIIANFSNTNFKNGN